MGGGESKAYNPFSKAFDPMVFANGGNGSWIDEVKVPVKAVSHVGGSIKKGAEGFAKGAFKVQESVGNTIVSNILDPDDQNAPLGAELKEDVEPALQGIKDIAPYADWVPGADVLTRCVLAPAVDGIEGQSAEEDFKHCGLNVVADITAAEGGEALKAAQKAAAKAAEKGAVTTASRSAALWVRVLTPFAEKGALAPATRVVVDAGIRGAQATVNSKITKHYKDEEEAEKNTKEKARLAETRRLACEQHLAELRLHASQSQVSHAPQVLHVPQADDQPIMASSDKTLQISEDDAYAHYESRAPTDVDDTVDDSSQPIMPGSTSLSIASAVLAGGLLYAAYRNL